MKKSIAYILLILLLASFSSKNEFETTSYSKEIPFNFDYGAPIIKVTISNREYNFLFDTGMPTVLSKNISEEPNLTSSRTVTGTDVNYNSQQESYAIVDEIAVGGISFKKIEALITDLSAGFEIGCLKLDGIVGNNLIKESIWEIDYDKKVIRLTDTIDNFDIPDNAEIIKFKTNSKQGYYSPNVEVTINKKKHKSVKFDTGSTGGIKLPLATYSSFLDKTKSAEYYGKASAALYGKGNNKNYVDSNVNSIEIDDLKLENQIVTFEESYPTIGNLLFKNYRIIISYNESKIYMCIRTIARMGK